jgi:precorrin-6A/cobalt-precorrin-6A reductase
MPSSPMPTMDSQRGDAAVCAMASAGITRILVLGGTREARQLGERLAERRAFAVTLSLAGRTAAPVPAAVPVRTGGFGGADGLAAYLEAERIDVLVDATHPYAAVISANAVAAAAANGIAVLALRRAPWRAVAGDRWTEVADAANAVAALGAAPRRVFLALGRQEIAPFATAPQHRYLVRSVEPVTPPLAVPHAVYITGRGPFREDDERALLTAHRIDAVVAKNSGGAASYGKIAAARAHGIAVILLRRPPLPPVPANGAAVSSVEDALVWLDQHAPAPAARGV